MRLTRVARFSCGHRFWDPSLTPEENTRRFGIYASPYNHGHNYELHVTVEGDIQPTTGMVVNIRKVKEDIEREIVQVLDRKSLNDEVEPFDRVPPNLENLIRWIAERIPAPGGAKLRRLRLYEMHDFYSELDLYGEAPMLTLTRGYHFSASHRLHSPHLSDEENQALFGPCNNPHGHGHNYELEVTIGGDADPKTGMLVDIDELDAVVQREVVERYDHRNLNVELPEFQNQNPTSEMLLREIWKRLRDKVPARLVRVVLRETPRNVFEYSEENE
ncbi:MAG: 6-pyruvoyltetrahydropterin synthase [Fimbriimonadales bacterium]|nr:MAG: 6-pyruvoyltetrahydropterin synthase [Fimbriimonadales bacterium]